MLAPVAKLIDWSFLQLTSAEEITLSGTKLAPMNVKVLHNTNLVVRHPEGTAIDGFPHR